MDKVATENVNENVCIEYDEDIEFNLDLVSDFQFDPNTGYNIGSLLLTLKSFSPFFDNKTNCCLNYESLSPNEALENLWKIIDALKKAEEILINLLPKAGNNND